MHGKDTLRLSNVTGALISEEIRNKGNGAGGVMESGGALVATSGRKKKSGKAPKGPCWVCGQSGHLKSDCLDKGKGTKPEKFLEEKLTM